LTASRLDQVEARGRTTCVITRLEFETLCREREVRAEPAGILRELGVLGYAGAVTIFDAEDWEESPLRFRRL